MMIVMKIWNNLYFVFFVSTLDEDEMMMVMVEVMLIKY